MDGFLAINVLFNSIQSYQDDVMKNNERLCAMVPIYGWEDFRLGQVSNLVRYTSRPAPNLLGYQGY